MRPAAVGAVNPRDPGCKPAAGHKPAVAVETVAEVEHPMDQQPALRLAAAAASDTTVGYLGIGPAVAASSLRTAVVAAVAAAACHRLVGPAALDSLMRGFQKQKRQGCHN